MDLCCAVCISLVFEEGDGISSQVPWGLRRLWVRRRGRENSKDYDVGHRSQSGGGDRHARGLLHTSHENHGVIRLSILHACCLDVLCFLLCCLCFDEELAIMGLKSDKRISEILIVSL
jgi:hypothetical protein